jgi:hypothetical protein
MSGDPDTRHAQPISTTKQHLPTSAEESNLGKWDSWYAELDRNNNSGFVYGDLTTYLMAASFFAEIETVEDWGCGTAVFRRFYSGKYIGIDGSKTPFASQIVDLCTYRSNVPGILLRHVLEHNYNWEKILVSALNSFSRKLCLILFTPFSDRTYEINHNLQYGVDVPDLSLSKLDLERHFVNVEWRKLENIRSNTVYGIEHIYFIWRN